ncbi:hypothetical protein ABT008_22830 [Micromonospora sp. NPDC002389]|uniref:hypothetical protein n=1 Tax=Micromonospora sp. NPDC002389 TaxID=3154272 RepID=UPI00332B80C9
MEVSALAVDTLVETKRPGWPEILVGLAVMALVGYGLPITLDRTGAADGLSPVTSGLILAALSGVAGLIAFAAAARIRSTNWSDLGVRTTTGRWAADRTLPRDDTRGRSKLRRRFVAGSRWCATSDVGEGQQ